MNSIEKKLAPLFDIEDWLKLALKKSPLSIKHFGFFFLRNICSRQFLTISYHPLQNTIKFIRLQSGKRVAAPISQLSVSFIAIRRCSQSCSRSRGQDPCCPRGRGRSRGQYHPDARLHPPPRRDLDLAGDWTRDSSSGGRDGFPWTTASLSLSGSNIPSWDPRLLSRMREAPAKWSWVGRSGKDSTSSRWLFRPSDSRKAAHGQRSRSPRGSRRRTTRRSWSRICPRIFENLHRVPFSSLAREL